MFTREQEQALAAPLDGAHVKQRQGANRQALSYLEGWQLIADANPTFSTGGPHARKTTQNRALGPKGLHYMTVVPAPTAVLAAVIRGGGCGGNASLSCCRSIFWSREGSVYRLRIKVRPSVVGKCTSSI